MAITWQSRGNREAITRHVIAISGHDEAARRQSSGNQWHSVAISGTRLHVHEQRVDGERHRLVLRPAPHFIEADEPVHLPIRRIEGDGALDVPHEIPLAVPAEGYKEETKERGPVVPATRRTQTPSDALRRTQAHRRTIRHNPIADTNWTCHQAQSNRSYQLDLSAQYERRPSLRIAWSSYAMKKVTNPSRQLSTRRSLGSPLASSESYHSRLRGRMVAWGVIRPDSSRSKRRRT